MPSNDQRAALIAHVANLEENAVLDLVRQRLTEGEDPLKIVEECQEGMRQVGLRYERGEYYLAGLIMAGEIFREVTEIVQPLLEHRIRQQSSGRVLLGTVQGDIHDMGKNMLAMLLSCYGFTVIDLGVDVAPTEFAARAVEIKPDIVGLSALLTSAHEKMRETVSLLRGEAKRTGAKFSIIIGGGQIDEQVRTNTGADYYGQDAMMGVRLCQRLMTEHSIVVDS
ncbi:MAG: cobalamin B12-binding domain-containing protein [Chloroflexi bacterium]|nr:cobalamin B12-binding domain-containing protein [Chloroflexota bacterium]